MKVTIMIVCLALALLVFDDVQAHAKEDRDVSARRAGQEGNRPERRGEGNRPERRGEGEERRPRPPKKEDNEARRPKHDDED